MSTQEQETKTGLAGIKAFFSTIASKFQLDPLTQKRFDRFFEIKRAKWSLFIVIVLYIFSLIAELFISNRPLVMSVDGKLYFPTYTKMLYAKDFGFQVGNELELNYREFAVHLKETKRGWAFLPFIPYNPYETDNDRNYPLAMTFKSAPVLGFAITSPDNTPGNDRTLYNWVPIGEYDGFEMPNGTYTWIVFGATENPSTILQSPNKNAHWIGFATNKTTKFESNNVSDYIWHKIGSDDNEIPLPDGKVITIRYSMSKNGDMYHPLPPSLSRRHIFGTDTIGRDVFARIVYGFRYAMSFALIVTFFTYVIGILLGLCMGYYGGLFDIIFQRVVEIWNQIPYLYMIMILSSIFKPSFMLFVIINIVFGWSARTGSVRIMTYREREHDYILAAKSMGASTWRIITSHILPNIIVVIVTALPFSISGGISALTALDYLGYGLQAPTPSWGELLTMGTNNYNSAPWILSSIVTSCVLILVMVTFVGEGLRDAFDPKRYTVYK